MEWLTSVPLCAGDCAVPSITAIILSVRGSLVIDVPGLADGDDGIKIDFTPPYRVREQPPAPARAPHVTPAGTYGS